MLVVLVCSLVSFFHHGPLPTVCLGSGVRHWWSSGAGKLEGSVEDTWAWLLVFVLFLTWNAVCLPVLPCGFSLHSCVQSQHGGRRRAVHALQLRTFSSTSKMCLVLSLCHSWPHLVACRHASRRGLGCVCRRHLRLTLLTCRNKSAEFVLSNQMSLIPIDGGTRHAVTLGVCCTSSGTS